jgi:hypothetical protein
MSLLPPLAPFLTGTRRCPLPRCFSPSL